MATFTWDARELLILETVNDGYESGDLVQNSTALAEILGLSVDESEQTVRALYEADYLDGSPSLSTAGFDLHLMRPTERARREFGQWPTVNPVRRPRSAPRASHRRNRRSGPAQPTREGRDGLLSMGREIGTSLLIAVVKGQVGLP